MPPPEPTPLSRPPAAAVSASLETLEAVYAAWTERRTARDAQLAQAASERARLEVEGRFLVGAARAAGSAPSTPAAGQPAGAALVPAESFESLVREAEARVAATLSAFEQAHAEALAAADAACAELAEAAVVRVRRYALAAPLPVQLWLRPVGRDRAVVHLARPSPDGAVLLFFLLTGSIPSRHGFLSDESTEDLALGPPPLYPDEGLSPADLRPDAEALSVRLATGGPVLPVRGFIPLWLAGGPGGPGLFRFLQRGPVLELEQLQEGAFQGVLPLAQAERVAGLLLRLRVEGRLQLEISSG
ncbi:MAG: hypothetical protein FJ086_15865 [Deltaproteobacteria bacterium]|nr:hypothetical protein [Deltaproteobacteria bacterium]